MIYERDINHTHYTIETFEDSGYWSYKVYYRGTTIADSKQKDSPASYKDEGQCLVAAKNWASNYVRR